MAGLPSATSSAYGVYPTYPPARLLSFNPWKNPGTLTPPRTDGFLARPFNISPHVYEALLHPAIPVTVAILYLVAVYRMNKLNKERNYKSWVNDKEGVFFYLVFAHNVLLTVFSAWICAGMFNAIVSSWPGWKGKYGAAGVADALCKINGPRGLGSAATYDVTTSSWGFTDRNLKLFGGAPDSSDVGRIWNEGLAYYGFLFYLSKLYEIVDTAIILAKGKTSPRLQSFHHAGAMICVWAGIRYMSPPIWMFTFINSGIHTLMYTYYAVAPLRNIPPRLKQTLTTLQTFQIVFGISYAVLHLFIAYDLPASTPYIFAKNLSSALPTAASTVSSAATSIVSSVDFTAWLKKAALRAAGEEGLAENVRNYQGETFGIDAVHAAQVEKAQEEIRYRLTTRKVHCLDTSGQVFAILLNAIYLVPLAYMFGEFYYDNYIVNTKRGRSTLDMDEPIPSTPENIKKSAQDAVNRVSAKVKEAIEDTQGGVTEPPPELKAQLDDLHTKAKQIAKNADEAARDKSVKAKEEMEKDLAKMQERLKALREKGNDIGNNAADKIKDAAANAKENAKKGASKAQQEAQGLGNKAKDAVQPALDAVANTADNVKRGVQDGYKKAQEAAQAAKEEAQKAADEAEKKADNKGHGAKKSAKDTGDAAKKSAEDTDEKAKESYKDVAEKSSKVADGSAAKNSDDKKDPGDQASEDTTAVIEDAKLAPLDSKATESQAEDKKEGAKEDSANSLAPSASTEDERSISSTGTGSGSRSTTPSGKKKDKKDKKK